MRKHENTRPNFGRRIYTEMLFLAKVFEKRYENVRTWHYQSGASFDSSRHATRAFGLGNLPAKSSTSVGTAWYKNAVGVNRHTKLHSKSLLTTM